jgi:hypothetical protein
VTDLTFLERAVLEKLLAGEHPALVALRAQAKLARMAKRELTGVGFYCAFDVPPEAPAVDGSPDFTIDDVKGESRGLAHGAGFVVFVRSGRLASLEGFTYDEPWPLDPTGMELSYLREPRDLKLSETDRSPTPPAR